VTAAFPFLLQPLFWSARNRARRREPGDGLRALLFGGIGLVVALVLFAIAFWLTWQLLDYEELGDYLIRLGLGWLFLTFLSFVAFSAVVSALTTFFLSEDLRLLLPAPVPKARLFYSRFARTVGQAGWMVAAFVLPVLLGLGLARCAPARYYLAAVLTVVPFVLIPSALGTLVTLGLVSVFPARRARDVLMLMGLLFAVGLVLLVRFLRPERLLSVQSLPDVTAFFATLSSPVTPLLPSFWAGESLFTALRGGLDAFHLGALWTTAAALSVLARAAYGRQYFSAWSKAQEARKARFTRLRLLEPLLGALPLPLARRALLVKDLKVFLRDTAQWSQLLLLVALGFVYVYNFRVLDLDKIPYMGQLLKSAYAFVNLAMAAFVTAAVAVRFVFPAVSAEGPAFWVVRTSPVPLSFFLWSKLWSGLLPILLLGEAITIASNQLLGVPAALKVLGAVAVAFMTLALVGLACGMGAEHPRFSADNPTQIAGSYGGVAFMVLAVLYILATVGLLAWPASIYLWHHYRGIPISPRLALALAASLTAAALLSVGCFTLAMRRGVRALEALG
jgi:ABC-2 type transport system permease protein